MKHVDIAGGGLAGLALGLALRRRGVPVTVLEAGAYPRHRVCGEFISGIQEAELEALGVAHLFARAQAPLETAWWHGGQPLLRATLPEAGRGISRHYLDAAMAELLVAAGGEVQTSTRAPLEAREGLVLATGRASRPSPWLGLKAHFTDLPLTADLEMHLGQHGYVGLTAVEDGHVNVSGLFRRQATVPRGAHPLVQAAQDIGLAGLAARLEAARPVEGSLKGVKNFSLGWQAADRDAICVGDAAAMIPPVTGNGMTMALQSALAAADPLLRWSRGEADWAAARQAVVRAQRLRFAARLRWARGLQWMLLQPWARRLCAHAVTRRWVSFHTFYAKVR